MTRSTCSEIAEFNLEIKRTLYHLMRKHQQNLPHDPKSEDMATNINRNQTLKELAAPNLT